MADRNIIDRFGFTRRWREVRRNEYSPEFTIAEVAGPGFGLHFDTDNAMQVALKANVFRIESTGTFDSTLWTTGHVGSGAATHTTVELVLSTGATPNSTSKLTSVQMNRQMSGTSQRYITVVRVNNPSDALCIRRWGLYDDNNGFFFQLMGGVLYAGYRKAGVDTLVPESDFNGPSLNGVTLDHTTMNQFDILFGGLSGRWLINGRNAHSIGTNTLTSPLTEVLSLPFRQEVINSGGNSTDNKLWSRGQSFHRIGPSEVTPRYRMISTATTTVVKVGAGTLKGLVVNNAAATATVTLYDNTSAAGTQIAIINIPASSNSPFDLNYGLEFNVGLTVVTSATNNITVIFD